jgi:Dyp-type peroxidase family
MTPLHEFAEPINNQDLPRLQGIFENLQGNILSGHGRNRSVHVFLSFKSEKNQAKAWIRTMAECVTSTQKQLEEAEAYRNYNVPGHLFCSFFLSAEGYRYLDLPLAGHCQAFVDGMQGARERLRDPVVETWEEGYQKAIHAMVLLADNDEDFLLRKAQYFLDNLRAVAEIRAVELGRAMRNAHGDHIEHFGYVHGRSQPHFFQRGIAHENAALDGTDRWNPGAGPNLVIVKEPNGGEDDFGSYLVFRKLEQNVRGFQERTAELARALGLQGEDAERAGALAIGRFADGTPVVLRDAAGMHNPVPNNFTFANDPDGRKCPFHAHIRKVNPRGEFARELDEPHNIELQHRIARRGMPYGRREKEPKDHPSLAELPTAGVGLLFMCYQKDIAEQFEFLQTKWASSEDFLRDETGIDPIIGQAGRNTPLPQNWPAQWNTAPKEHTPFSFHGFVTLKGGEYFFAPSINFLRAI